MFISRLVVDLVSVYGTTASSTNTTASLNTVSATTTAYSASTSVGGTSPWAAYSTDTDSASAYSTDTDNSPAYSTDTDSTPAYSTDTYSTSAYSTDADSRADTTQNTSAGGTSPYSTDTGSSAVSKQNLCQCRCAQATAYSRQSNAILKSQSAEAAKELEKALSIASTSTGSYVRKKTSAPDDRISAKSSGLVAVVILSIVFMMIVFPDVVAVAEYLTRVVKTLTGKGGEGRQKQPLRS